MATTTASREAGLTISDRKLQMQRPWLYGWRGILTMISNFIGPGPDSKKTLRRHVQLGDANAAVVVSGEPLLVAAYSEDIDAVTLLYFRPDVAEMAGRPAVGTRLVAVNTYRGDGPVEGDLVRGPRAAGGWVDFHPLIGELMSDDQGRLHALKQMIPADHWARCEELVGDYQARNPGRARDGRPGYGGMMTVPAS